MQQQLTSSGGGHLVDEHIVLKAQEASGKTEPELSYAEVLNTYKSICEHNFS